MTSLWQLTGPRIPSSPVAEVLPPGGGARFDTVVVGAGITGITTALLLSRAGQRVLVLEARTAGAVTTGNTTGKLSLLQGTVLSEIRSHSGDDALRAYVEANREGQAWLLRELDARGVTVERRTAYTYATGSEDLERLASEVDAARVAGLGVDETGEAGLPFAIAGALRLPEQAQLHPMVVLAELAAEMRERGGALVEHCRVRGADADEHGIRLETRLGDVTADACVLATGTPVLDRGMFFARHEPSRSFVSAYRLSEAAVPEGMHVSVDAPFRSLRSARDAAGDPVLVVGGGAHVTGRGGDTRRLLEEIDDWTRDRFGAAEGVVSWAAQDYRSHSRVPFTGAIPGGRGRIFAATGYNKWGMTNGVAAALALTADILGDAPEWARALREHQHGLEEAGDALRANAAVAGRLIGGWGGAEFSGPGAEQLQPGGGGGVMARDGLAPVGVARVDGRVCRVSGVCTHLGGILNWNAAERSWDCPLHGSRFAADGALLEGPAVDDLPQR